MKKIQFKDLAIGEKFTMNGMLCTKKSTRTAWIGGRLKNRWFYWGQLEYVKKGW